MGGSKGRPPRVLMSAGMMAVRLSWLVSQMEPWLADSDLVSRDVAGNAAAKAREEDSTKSLERKFILIVE